MNQPNDSPNSMQDDRLADFTDRVMEGRVKQVESDVDEELIDLENTILRLNRAFPQVSLDEATVKQMQVRLKARMRREEQRTKKPFWIKWFMPQFRFQFGFAFVVVALAIIFVIFSPLFAASGSSVTATALTPMNSLPVVVLAGVILVILWVWTKRRK